MKVIDYIKSLLSSNPQEAYNKAYKRYVEVLIQLNEVPDDDDDLLLRLDDVRSKRKDKLEKVAKAAGIDYTKSFAFNYTSDETKVLWKEFEEMREKIRESDKKPDRDISELHANSWRIEQCEEYLRKIRAQRIKDVDRLRQHLAELP